MERDPENDMLIGPDGAHYNNEREAYHFALLKLCGCGNPEEAYSFCYGILKLCDRRDRSAKWIDAQGAVKELIRREPEIAAHTFLHLLTNLDLLEHGGSVGGSWLTTDGEKIVDSGPAADDEFDDQ